MENWQYSLEIFITNSQNKLLELYYYFPLTSLPEFIHIINYGSMRRVEFLSKVDMEGRLLCSYFISPSVYYYWERRQKSRTVPRDTYCLYIYSPKNNPPVELKLILFRFILDSHLIDIIALHTHTFLLMP